jgi:hypothetical protein
MVDDPVDQIFWELVDNLEVQISLQCARRSFRVVVLFEGLDVTESLPVRCEIWGNMLGCLKY